MSYRAIKPKIILFYINDKYAIFKYILSVFVNKMKSISRQQVDPVSEYPGNTAAVLNSGKFT